MTPSSQAVQPGNTGHAPGRKRDASRDDALCKAALEVLADVGYDRLTIDAVATRAGAGKATCYRRWADKAELVVDAVSRMKAQPALPDTGTLRGDLIELTGHFHDADDAFRTDVQAGLVSGLVHDAKLREVFLKQFIAPRKAVFRTVFDRAVERGEITSGVDCELLSDVVPSMVFHRLIMTGRVSDNAFVRRVIDQIVLPATTASTTATMPETENPHPAENPSPSQTQTRTPSS